MRDDEHCGVGRPFGDAPDGGDVAARNLGVDENDAGAVELGGLGRRRRVCHIGHDLETGAREDAVPRRANEQLAAGEDDGTRSGPGSSGSGRAAPSAEREESISAVAAVDRRGNGAPTTASKDRYGLTAGQSPGRGKLSPVQTLAICPRGRDGLSDRATQTSTGRMTMNRRRPARTAASRDVRRFCASAPRGRGQPRRLRGAARGRAALPRRRGDRLPRRRREQLRLEPHLDVPHPGAPVLGQGARALVVSALSLGANQLFLVVLVAAGAGHLAAQAVAIVLATPFSFAANKLWAFARADRLRPAPARAAGTTTARPLSDTSASALGLGRLFGSRHVVESPAVLCAEEVATASSRSATPSFCTTRRDVRADAARLELQPSRDLAGREAFGEAGEHVPLAARQPRAELASPSQSCGSGARSCGTA